MKPSDLVLTRRGVRFQNRYYPCTIGRGGIRTNKSEGDGATPRATLHVTGMLYRPDRMAKPTPWAAPIRPGDLWSDASDDTDYNQLVRAPYPHSHENLRRADPIYDIILLTDWNWPIATPGKGSAIFLHQWRRPGYTTEGCIAFARAHLHHIAAHITPGTGIIIR